MALLCCPECGRQAVSDKAIACPSCAFPLSQLATSNLNSPIVQVHTEEKPDLSEDPVEAVLKIKPSFLEWELENLNPEEFFR